MLLGRTILNDEQLPETDHQRLNVLTDMMLSEPVSMGRSRAGESAEGA
jgi:hypothetical protein